MDTIDYMRHLTERMQDQSRRELELMQQRAQDDRRHADNIRVQNEILHTHQQANDIANQANIKADEANKIAIEANNKIDNVSDEIFYLKQEIQNSRKGKWKSWIITGLSCLAALMSAIFAGIAAFK